MDPLDSLTELPDAPESDQLPELDADPKPGRQTRRRRASSDEAPARSTRSRAKLSTGASAPRPKSSAALVKDIKAEIETYLTLGAAAWSISDEGCAAALSEQTSALAESAAVLIARNPRLVEMFHTGTLIGDWGKLFMAGAPVLKAMWAHHGVRKPVDQEEAAGVGAYEQRFPAYAPR